MAVILFDLARYYRTIKWKPEPCESPCPLGVHDDKSVFLPSREWRDWSYFFVIARRTEWTTRQSIVSRRTRAGLSVRVMRTSGSPRATPSRWKGWWWRFVCHCEEGAQVTDAAIHQSPENEAIDNRSSSTLAGIYPELLENLLRKWKLGLLAK